MIALVPTVLGSAWHLHSTSSNSQVPALRRILEASPKPIYTVLSSTGDRRIAIGNAAGAVAVWDSRSARLLYRLPAVSHLRTSVGVEVALSSDGHLLARSTERTGAGSVVQVWSLSGRGSKPKRVLSITKLIDFVGFGSDDTLLLVPNAATTPYTLVLYNIQTHKRRAARLKPVGVGPSGAVYVAKTHTFFIASSAAAGYIKWRIGQPRTSSVNAQCNGSNVLSSNGALFACLAEKVNLLSIWNLAEGRQLGQWAPPVTSQGANSLAFVNGSQEVAVVVTKGAHQSIEVYRVKDHSVAARFDLPNAPLGYAGATNIWSVGSNVVGEEVATAAGSQLRVRTFAFATP